MAVSSSIWFIKNQSAVKNSAMISEVADIHPYLDCEPLRVAYHLVSDGQVSIYSLPETPRDLLLAVRPALAPRTNSTKR